MRSVAKTPGTSFLPKALKVLEMMQESGKPLSELASGMEEFPQELHGLDVSEKPPIESVPELIQVISEVEDELGAEGRVLVRYSGTENKIRVLVEAKCALAAKSASDKICAVVESTIGIKSPA